MSFPPDDQLAAALLQIPDENGGRPEEWRPVVGFEGSYQVSSLGRVRSLDRTVRHPSGSLKRLRGKELKIYLNKGGYCRTDLCIDGRRVPALVHQLVAAAFIGPMPAGKEVRHWDGNRSNNAAPNLLYGTRLENERDKIRHGTANRGERASGAKLTETQIKEIRCRRARGELTSRLAQEYGISGRHARKIIAGDRWGWT